ncbi:MAG TPA: methyltransferase domain-containing protein [Burkholderiaceae bacterium]|nr:methyltransferase domain-containing protein [Burkholderiaceae bacterium]
MATIRRRFFIATVCALVLTGCASRQSPEDYKPARGQAGKDVIWLPTAQTVVDRMLDMAKVSAGDYLVDLGSGDGRLVITAAKRGARAHGIEFNPDLVALSRRTARAEGVAGRATFEQADIFESDFSKATVVTLFLLPELNLKLRSTLLAMKPGTRVVSNSFSMEGWQPDQMAEVREGCVGHCNAFLWTVPAPVRGRWRMGDRELVLEQSYQVLEGTLRGGGGGGAVSALPVQAGRLDGEAIVFTIGGRRHTGRVSGDTMSGTVEGGAGWTATRIR